MVVTVGIDVHKQTHCAVAIDQAGRQVGKLVTVRTTDAGHRQLLRWAQREFARRGGVRCAALPACLASDGGRADGRCRGGGAGAALTDGPDPDQPAPAASPIGSTR